MKWDIRYSPDADKFIDKQNIRAEVREQLEFFLRKMRGEPINVDVKKLKGDWKGYLRIRKGQRLELFLSSPFARQLRTHKLSGKLEGLWAFSVDEDCRVVFDFIGEDRVLLIDNIGSHDEVY